MPPWWMQAGIHLIMLMCALASIHEMYHGVGLTTKAKGLDHNHLSRHLIYRGKGHVICCPGSVKT